MTEYTGWRSRVPILSHCIPMNHCSQAPLTDLTRAAAERFLDSWNQRGMDWDAWMEEVGLAKLEFARLINADPEEIAVFSSVSEAASAVASASAKMRWSSTTRTRIRPIVRPPCSGSGPHRYRTQRTGGAREGWGIGEVSSSAADLTFAQQPRPQGRGGAGGTR